jgi:hypothetical protein
MVLEGGSREAAAPPAFGQLMLPAAARTEHWLCQY